MLREKERGSRPVPLKQFGAALALSFAGYLFSRFQTRHIATSHHPKCADIKDESDAQQSGVREEENVHPTQEEAFTIKTVTELSPYCNKSADTERFLLPEFNDLVKEFDPSANPVEFSPRKHLETPKSNTQSPLAPKTHGLDEHELEIKQLNSMVKSLQERERNLELQLLEYYGLKEQETAMRELQSRLKINGMEAQLFALKTESLQATNRRLETQVADCSKHISELEAARAKIKMLKRKLRFEAEQSKQQILVLKKKVEKLQEEEQKAMLQSHDVYGKLQRLEKLEVEAEELRLSNEKLQLENSDLSLRLQLAEVTAVAEQEARNLKEENERLMQKNKDLGQEIEQLQADRCTDAEELVYLRWVNACLRHELRFKNSQSGKSVAIDLSKSLSPNSAEKAKKLILKYANGEGGIERDTDMDSDISSLASCPSASGNVEDSLANDNSLNTVSTTTSEPKFLRKLKKFLNIKQESRGAWAKSESGDIVTSIGDNLHSDSSELESSHCSSSISTVADANRFSMPHSSWDMDDIKDIARLQRTSTDSSSYRFMKYSSARTSMSDQDQALTPSSDLLKYAEALRDSRVAVPYAHKKSKSFNASFTQ